MARIKYYDASSGSWQYADIASGTNGITPHIGANGNWYIGETDTGMPSRGEPGYGGITDVEKSLLLSLLKGAAYTSDMSDTIKQLEVLWGGGGEEPDVPDVPDVQTYSVTHNLTGVISSNSVDTVNDGDSYSTTLTVEDGYILNSVVITMGGDDITANAYGDGYVLITNVSGDVVITAIAEQPQYIPTTANSYVDAISFYSGEQDDTSNRIGNRTYTKGVVYATVVPETDTEVTIRLLNNTESDVSAGCYVGATHTAGGTQPKIYYSQTGYTGTVRANGNVEFKYVVPAGKYLCVFTGSADIDAEVIGNYTVRQPVAEYEMVSSSYDSYAWYADGTTENLKVSGNYSTYINSVNVFEEDTPLRITIMGDGTFKGNIMAGSRLDNKDGNAYYVDGYGGFANKIPVGGMAVHHYTVRAGHHLTVDNTNGTIYVERA